MIIFKMVNIKKKNIIEKISIFYLMVEIIKKFYIFLYFNAMVAPGSVELHENIFVVILNNSIIVVSNDFLRESERYIYV
jgi:hypothetical protein